jgi:DNA polymerase III delta prime subunit
MMDIKSDEFLWVEKYRPQTVQDAILPKHLERTFLQFVESGEIPNLLLCGTAGVGKTTVAKALCEQMGYDWIILNGSSEGDIDTLRTKITNFASTVSFGGGGKVVIYDEADYLTAVTQPALRNFIEEFSKNCRFIFTCNYKNKIIPALHSRCSVIEFNIPKDEKPILAGNFFKRVTDILALENVEYTNSTVAGIVSKFFPDFRRTLNELQKISIGGRIDAEAANNSGDVEIKAVVDYCKTKDFQKMRKWVADTIHTSDAQDIYRKVYDTMSEYMQPQSIPLVVLKIADYQYKNVHVADQEVNMVAFFTEVMVDCEFK